MILDEAGGGRGVRGDVRPLARHAGGAIAGITSEALITSGRESAKTSAGRRSQSRRTAAAMIREGAPPWIRVNSCPFVVERLHSSTGTTSSPAHDGLVACSTFERLARETEHGLIVW